MNLDCSGVETREIEIYVLTSRLNWLAFRWKYILLFTSNGQKYPPIVEINVELNASSENLNNTQVLPTPESPINKSLNK